MNIKISEKAVLYRINQRKDYQKNKTIGAYIRRERIAQGLKQELVCKDICSVSYYSRIESNKVIPSDWYISKIFEKLNRPIPEDLSQEFSQHNKEVINNFLTAIEYKNDKLMEEEYLKLKDLQGINMDLYDFIYNICHKNLENLTPLIKKLSAQQIHFENDELLVFLENMCVYYVLTNDIKKAENYISYAIELQNNMNLNKPSILYRYAWILGKLNYDFQCINYAQKADELYLLEQNTYRSVQCKLLIALKFNKYFPEKAIALYKDCLKITNNSNISDLRNTIFFNMALVYKKLKQYDLCEEILLDLINSYLDNESEVFDLYLELIDLYILYNKDNIVLEYYEKLKNSNIDNEKKQIYLNYYKYKFIEFKIDEAIDMYIIHFIPYFIRNNNNDMIIKSRYELAKLYEKKGNYIECINQFKTIYEYINQNIIMN